MGTIIYYQYQLKHFGHLDICESLDHRSIIPFGRDDDLCVDGG